MKNSDKSKDKIHNLIDAFDFLGKQLRIHNDSKPEEVKPTTSLDKAVEAAYVQNAWFTLANIHSAFRNWSDVLRRETMMNWLSVYPDPEWNNQTVGLVLAGNLPLVGFHDVICVLLSGHKSSYQTIL